MGNNTYNELFKLDFAMFKELLALHDIDINEEHLLFIYNLIQNNRHALIDSHYNAVLFNCISEKTSKSTCLKIKNFLSNCSTYFKFGLNV